MANVPLRSFVRDVRRALGSSEAAGVSDSQLLERFVTARDDAAFELLVWRHERMVLGVCRRVLRDPHDAEDAFQAAFLALARKAGSIGRREAVASWLYQVTYRIALRARTQTRRRAAHERQGLDVSWLPSPDNTLANVARRDLGPLLDRELSRLPEKYRAPVILCYLEEKTYEEAARQLGCSTGTLSTRLTWARQALRRRLSDPGLALPAGLLATTLGARVASARAPAALVDSAFKLALWDAAAKTASVNGASARVIALAEGAFPTMSLTKVKMAAGFVIAGLAGLGISLCAYQSLAAEPVTPTPLVPAQQVGEVRCFTGHAAPVLRAVFSPDGRRVASSSMDGTVRLWDVETGKELRHMVGHQDRVDCVLFTPAGRQLLSCAWDGTIRLWDAETGKQLNCFVAPAEPGIHLANIILMPGGREILVNAVDHHALQLLSLETGKVVKEFADHPDHVAAVAVSADGRRVLEGNWDGHLRLWDIESGKLLRAFGQHPGHVYGLALTPDGRQALSSSLSDNTVRLWDVAGGQEVRRLEGHAKHIDFVAISPDGRRALSCGPDQTVRLWHVETGTELRRYFGHTDRVQCVSFSPDGRYAVSGGDDHTIRLWRLPK